jgi:uncharacterized protein (UPF0276 family)
VTGDVWELFTLAWQLTGGAATLLEWDSNIPEFEDYRAELLKAKDFMKAFNRQPRRERVAHEGVHQVSNPVDFLVADMQYEFGK